MHESRRILTVGAFVASMVLCALFFAHPQEKNAESSHRITDNEVHMALKALWSPNKTEREAAKEKLLEIGQEAIPPLISLLEDVTSNRGPRFETGKEKEGAEAWQRFHATPSEHQSVEMMRTVAEIEITDRLKSDALDLLGQLRAEEAVPLIVRLMSTDGMILSKKHAEMQALVRIGAAAVPKLIEIIQTPDATLASVEYWLGRPEHSEKPKSFRLIPRLIKSRAVMVLGDIGDASVLPVLEALPTATQDRDVTESVQEAVKKIRKRGRGA